MRKIRLSYPDVINAGDLFNKECVELLSGGKVIRSKVYNADMIAIGGALYGAQYSDGLVRRACQAGLGAVYRNRPLHVWGSGFIIPDNRNQLYRKNLWVHALRGQKSREKLERITGNRYDAVLADAGLLIDILLRKKIGKRYEIGIIPHFSQRMEPLFQQLAQQYASSAVIDIGRQPREVAQEIAACEYILSSSLHGLIFADSLHIPSRHILGCQPIVGGTFKFEDYYSSYGLEHQPWDLRQGYPSINDIIDGFRINFSDVENKKKQLLDVFPQFE